MCSIDGRLDVYKDIPLPKKGDEIEVPDQEFENWLPATIIQYDKKEDGWYLRVEETGGINYSIPLERYKTQWRLKGND